MTWNHRVLRQSQPDGSDWLAIHEVFYEDGVPHSCTVDAVGVGGETLAELTTVLEWMRLALAKPILDMAFFDAKTPKVEK